MVDVADRHVIGRCRRDGVLEGGGLGAGLGCLVVAGRVVRDRVEAVAAVDGVVVFIERHVVAEAGAAVAVGVRQAEAGVAGLLDVKVDGGDATAGARVFGVRVHRDRARVIELGAGGTRGRGLGVDLDGEVVGGLGVAGFVGGVVADRVGAVVCVVVGGGDRDSAAGAVAGRGVELVVRVLDAGAGFRAELGRIAGGERDGHAVVDVGRGHVVGRGRDGAVDVRGRRVHALVIARCVGREVLDDLPVAAQHRLARGVVDRARGGGRRAVGGVVGLVDARAAGVAGPQRHRHVLVDISVRHVVGGRRVGVVDEGGGSVVPLGVAG